MFDSNVVCSMPGKKHTYDNAHLVYLEAIERKLWVVYVGDVDIVEDVREHVVVAVGTPESQSSTLVSLNSLERQNSFKIARCGFVA